MLTKTFSIHFVVYRHRTLILRLRLGFMGWTFNKEAFLIHTYEERNSQFFMKHFIYVALHESTSFINFVFPWHVLPLFKYSHIFIQSHGWLDLELVSGVLEFHHILGGNQMKEWTNIDPFNLFLDCNYFGGTKCTSHFHFVSYYITSFWCDVLPCFIYLYNI